MKILLAKVEPLGCDYYFFNFYLFFFEVRKCVLLKK
jgi:hypothetical protein